MLAMPRIPLSLLSLLTTSLITTSTTATPLLHGIDIPSLFQRSTCTNPCGWAGQLCCGANQYCYTDSSDQAQCGDSATTTAAATGTGYWTVWTSTYVQTDLLTITSIGSSYIPTATASASCNYAANESPCGSICCAANQYCAASGQCAAAANPSSSGVYASSWAASPTTNAFSAPLRPTASTLVTVTGGAATTTEGFLSPVATGANSTLVMATHSSGLSGGAIAGIVIGTLIGLALLLCACFFLCIRGLLDWLLACLGFGRRTEPEKKRVVEEEYVSTRRGSRRGGGGTYYDRPSRVERRSERRSSSGVKEAVGIAAALGGLATLLGLKRARDRRKERGVAEEDKRTYYSEDVSQITSESECHGLI